MADHPMRQDHPQAAVVSRHLWSALLLTIAGFFFALTDLRTVYVTAPLAVTLMIATLFFRGLWCRRYPVVPWFEIGAVYVTVVTLYTAYPLIGYLALGGTYTPTNDTRLGSMQPGFEEVGRAGWLYVCHLVSFALVYSVVRGRLPVPPEGLRRPRLPVFVAIVAVYVAIEIFVIFLGLFFDIGANSYAETYLAVRRLPLVFAQLLNHLGGIRYVLSVMLLAALFSRYPATRPVIIVWIVLVGVVSVARLGGRTDLVLLVLSAVAMYHTVVRPISPRVVAVAALTGLTAFIAFGIWRNGGAPGGPSALNPFAYASEFESLFGNAVHLGRVRDSIGDLPLTFYFADLTSLVPQQFVPFVKIDRADWYVTTFFPAYAAMGGGLAFGTIADAILTGGWISAMARGAIVGICFAQLHRVCIRRLDRFWVFVFYVWVTTLSYQVFRNTTFALLVLIAYRFLPALLVVNVLAGAIRKASRAAPAIPMSHPAKA